MLLFCHVYILIWESNELCVHGIWKGITFTGWLSCVWLFCGLVDCSLLGASVYWTSQARRLECVAISFSRGSSQPRDRTCVPHTGLPRQEDWTGLPFPSPGDLPNPGIEPASPTLASGFFTAEPPGKPRLLENKAKKRWEHEKSHPSPKEKKFLGISSWSRG